MPRDGGEVTTLGRCAGGIRCRIPPLLRRGRGRLHSPVAISSHRGFHSKLLGVGVGEKLRVRGGSIDLTLWWCFVSPTAPAVGSAHTTACSYEVYTLTVPTPLLLQSQAPANGRQTRSSYRTVSKSSNVDESLFGSTKPGTMRGGGKAQVRALSFISPKLFPHHPPPPRITTGAPPRYEERRHPARHPHTHPRALVDGRVIQTQFFQL